VTFTNSPDDKNSHKLFVGASAGEGLWFARTEEREGTFVIASPDFNALKLPLIAAPGPTPALSAATVTPAVSTSPKP